MLSRWLSITDDAVVPLTRLFAHGFSHGLSIESGEFATTVLSAARRDTDVWHSEEFDRSSVILLIGIEGITDPELYRSIVSGYGSRAPTEQQHADYRQFELPPSTAIV